MSFRATALKRSPLLVLLLLTLGSRVGFGQAADSPIAFANVGAITTSLVQAPAIGSSSSTPSADSKWLKVEFHYRVAPKVGDFLDSAEFKVWVEGRDLLDPQGKPGEGIAVAITGSVTYVNIPAGKDLYGVVFLHPSTLARYSTKGGSSDFDRKFNIHVDILVGGDKMDAIDKNKDVADWYKPLRAVQGLVFHQDQSPFIVYDSDRYPALKLPLPPGQ